MLAADACVAQVRPDPPDVSQAAHTRYRTKTFRALARLCTACAPAACWPDLISEPGSRLGRGAPGCGGLPCLHSEPLCCRGWPRSKLSGRPGAASGQAGVPGRWTVQAGASTARHLHMPIFAPRFNTCIPAFAKICTSPPQGRPPGQLLRVDLDYDGICAGRLCRGIVLPCRAGSRTNAAQHDAIEQASRGNINGSQIHRARGARAHRALGRLCCPRRRPAVEREQRRAAPVGRGERLHTLHVRAGPVQLPAEGRSHDRGRLFGAHGRRLREPGVPSTQPDTWGSMGWHAASATRAA